MVLASENFATFYYLKFNLGRPSIPIPHLDAGMILAFYFMLHEILTLTSMEFKLTPLWPNTITIT